MPKLYQYYVEGECEEKLITVLKDNSNSLIVPGKVTVFNVQQEYLTEMRLRALKRKTTVVLVFDTDKQNIDILKENISILKKYGFNEVLLVFQVRNLEDELVYSTNIKQIDDLLQSKSKREFKRDFINEKKLMEKLNNHRFNIQKIWSKKPDGDYSKYTNDGNKIKKQK